MEGLNPFVLPTAPGTETGSVKAWAEAVTIPTYSPMPPDPNPMFLEKRVYQGSSGRVYPLPFIDRISTEREDRRWEAVHLENEFIRVMIMPELGGRIHVGMDKTNGYDFFYRQNVIKPALVGLAGPWISGGVEFNWPQHHRPATFMPVAFTIEEDSDGSKTVWCSDHDPMNRLKGMHGVCLHPSKAYVELKVRLYNRTPFVQTFLWWANVAARVHEQYQSFFPPDVHYVADHARRAISAFPLCEGKYYGVDYADRALYGVSAEERPAHFVPPGNYPPNDLGWYANIPVPTSYMALGSQFDFFGGYDHAREAGFVHVADHRIAPGKKQWTWGNHDFGYAWDRNLTDHDGPYIELMAGVYTDNQPDFSFLAPGETKSFSQYWYPIQKIGPVRNANREAAVSLSLGSERAKIGVSVTSAYGNAVVELVQDGGVERWAANIGPGKPFSTECSRKGDNALLRVLDNQNRELIGCDSGQAHGSQNDIPPQAATEPPLPEQIATNDELYLTGLHLEQYRHATRAPEAYWREALRRDPGDARANTALGRRGLERGEFADSEQHFRAAIARLTTLNGNPYDGEPFYYLGLTLRYLNRNGEARDAFAKATWNAPWRASSDHALAELASARQDWETAAEHLQSALARSADNLRARNLLTVVLRKQGKGDAADEVLRETLALYPLDTWTRQLAGQGYPQDNQLLLDLALDYGRAGLYAEAQATLDHADFKASDGSLPMVYYTLAWFAGLQNNGEEANSFLDRAAAAPTEYCFPVRLEELLMLENAVTVRPADARAHLYLGNLLYDKRRHKEAIAAWERAAALDEGLAVAWRNLGIGAYNVGEDPGGAMHCYDRAFRAKPSDARIFYERDQLRKRVGLSAHERLAEMEQHGDLVNLRDDLSVELATLYNQIGHPARAATLLASRKFQPWEGGEGLVSAQYVRSQLALGREALVVGQTADAVQFCEAAVRIPHHLGEAPHLLANRSHVFYWIGAAHAAAGNQERARAAWTRAASQASDFQEMSVKPFSELTFYSAAALQRLGEITRANQLLASLDRYAAELGEQPGSIDYFATSLPSMLLFDENLSARNRIAADFLHAQAAFGLGQAEAAAALLDRVLAADPNHSWAADFQREMPVLNLRPDIPIGERACTEA